MNTGIFLKEYKFAVEKAAKLEITLEQAYEENGALTEKIEKLEFELEYIKKITEYYRNPQEELEGLEDE